MSKASTGMAMAATAGVGIGELRPAINPRWPGWAWGGALWPDATVGGFAPIAVTSLNSLELEMDVVTRLEIDQGTHNLMVVLPLKPAGRITIWLDWYGPASDARSSNDGYGDYGHVPTPAGTVTVLRDRGHASSILIPRLPRLPPLRRTPLVPGRQAGVHVWTAPGKGG